MKPFLLLQTRPEDVTSDNEYEGFLLAGELNEGQLKRIRVEAAPLPAIDLNDYSGVIMGGGPFNSSDPEETKSDVQKRIETDLAHLLERIYEQDFPFFGACYGVGTLGKLLGGTISRKYGEPVAPTAISLTDEGKKDALLAGVPDIFSAIVGHKEACESLPTGAVLLASSRTCPVQMFRVKRNMYVTQFHPELNMEGFRIRVNAYKHAGYFPPEDAEAVIENAKQADLSFAPVTLRNFTLRYAQQTNY